MLLFPESAGFTKDDNLFTYQAKIIRQLAEEGSCVLIGRCADHVLKEMPGVVRVFVHAPADFCLREAMKVNSQPEKMCIRDRSSTAYEGLPFSISSSLAAISVFFPASSMILRANSYLLHMPPHTA